MAKRINEYILTLKVVGDCCVTVRLNVTAPLNQTVFVPNGCQHVLTDVIDARL